MILFPVIGSAQKQNKTQANQWIPISGLNAAIYISSLPGSKERITEETKSYFESDIGEKYKLKKVVNISYDHGYPRLVRNCNFDIKSKCLTPSLDEIENDWRYSRALAYAKHTGSEPRNVFGKFYLSANFVPFSWDLSSNPGYTDEKVNKGLYKFTDKMKVLYTKDTVYFSNSDGESLSVKVDRKKNHISFTENGKIFSYSNKHAQSKFSRGAGNASAGLAIGVMLLLGMGCI
jgi:hypothetical protein